MDSTSSRKKSFDSKNYWHRSSGKKSNPLKILSNIAMEISSDDSLHDEKETKNCAVTKNTSIESNASNDLTSGDTEEKNNPSAFDISTDTDSVVSDDFIQPSSTSYNSRKGMFSWLNQGTNSIERDQVISKSDKAKRKRSPKQYGPKRFTRNASSFKKYLEPSTSSNAIIKNKNKKLSTDLPNEDIPVEPTIQHEITIAGTKVQLPVKPYPCQIAVMNKVIQGCAREENCLLESPTGSGKTLALLCGALAWQNSFGEKVKKELQKMAKDDFNCRKECFNTESDPPAGCSTKGPMNSGALEGSNTPFSMVIEDCESDDNSQHKCLVVPKIYYGTRTHKQLAQVVKELGRSNYKDKTMTVLSSREHTCIQETLKSKTELCHDLLDGEKNLGGCPYYNDRNRRALVSFSQLAAYGVPTPFDIEDIVEVGKEEGLCPYFAARNLAEEAEIIFCPYNYIIDPGIRESMQIKLKGQVVILDEAHNVEDVCREIGSVVYREDDLDMVVDECEVLRKKWTEEQSIYLSISRYVSGLLRMIRSFRLNSMEGSDVRTTPCWTGGELLQLLKIHNLFDAKYGAFMEAAKAAIQDFIKTKEEIRLGIIKKNIPKQTVSRNTKNVLECLTFGLHKITSTDYVGDYRAVINESLLKSVKKVQNDEWVSARKPEKRLLTLKLMCMNPGVIFAPLARDARSIILASGTLTPMSSFQSELGIKFPHVLSANHVIGHDQVYVGCIPKGPTGVSLKANFKNVNKWHFQDELGELVLTVCSAVPHGILCFFSSYHTMNTQISRWKYSDCLHSIRRHKQVFIEPRNSGDLAQIMADYREAIEETSKSTITFSNPLSGAILFAVFRGKVAEGIDFSDNEARCVISIGIPYPVRKDPEVDMKWQYNDKYSSKGLLKGCEWYSVQAYRALNQAIGRCIRHKNDWGAILLIDDRFLNQTYRNNLPKWIKERWKNNTAYGIQEELNNFVTAMIKKDNENKAVD